MNTLAKLTLLASLLLPSLAYPQAPENRSCARNEDCVFVYNECGAGITVNNADKSAAEARFARENAGKNCISSNPHPTPVCNEGQCISNFPNTQTRTSVNPNGPVY